MIPICMTPGPESPKDIWSFLRPVLEELEILQDKGMTIKVGDLTFQVKVHVRFTQETSRRWPSSAGTAATQQRTWYPILVKAG